MEIFFNRVFCIIRSENRPSSEIEGGQRHAEIIVSEFGLTSERTKTAETPENRDAFSLSPFTGEV